MRLRNDLHGAIAGRIGWMVLAAVALGGWLFLIVDRLVEPSAGFRFAVEMALLAVGAGWLVVVAAPRLVRRIEDSDVVTLLHREHPRAADLISTSLDERRHPGGNKSLRDATIAEADAAALSLAAVSLVRPPSTSAVAWFALIAAGSALALAVARPDIATCFIKRVALSEAPWPRRVELLAEGFTRDEATGELTRVVARGEPAEFEVIAQVDHTDLPPETLWARGARGGSRQTLTTLTRVGAPEVVGHESGASHNGTIVRQRYRRRIERLDDDLALTIRGGDGRVRLRLIAASRPKLTDLVVNCTPPPYLNEPPTSTGATTLRPLPEGGVATIVAGASKKLASVEATFRNASAQSLQTLNAWVEEDGKRVTIQSPPLEESLVVTIVATAADGLVSEPIELPIEVAKDAPPSAMLTLDGVARAVTRDARLPVRVRLEDDHGVADARLELHTDDATVVVPIDPPATLPKTVRGEADLLSLRSADPEQRLALQPGDRVRLVATAADRYDLAERPRSESRSIEIEVVTPAELLARLGDAQRELRTTLESLRTDVERLEYEVDLERRRRADAEAESSLSRWAAERLLDARKIGDGVADAAIRADDLRRQVVNNRLEQPDLVDRLQRRIVGPLRGIRERHLADTAAAIRQAAGSVADKNGASDETTPSESVETPLAAALAGVRAAKTDLERVLTSLDTQQNYNEVVSLLRGLIREQQQVNEKTTRQESESVRSLFD
jgi:hypothetical protein